MKTLICALSLVISPSIALAGGPIMNDPEAATTPIRSFQSDAVPVPGADLNPLAGPLGGWTGLHVGINGGFGGDQEVYPFSASTGGATLRGAASLRSSGAIAGGQIGYDFGFVKGAVVGAEADIAGSTITSTASGGLNNGTVSLSGGSRINYIGTVRGRLGYSFDRVLVYGTGGFAYSDITSSIDAAAVGLGSLSGHVSQTHVGYAVGGGVEIALNEHVSVRSEFIRTVFDTKQLLAGSVGGIGYSLSERPTANLVRAGLNLRFDSLGHVQPTPVVARY